MNLPLDIKQGQNKLDQKDNQLCIVYLLMLMFALSFQLWGKILGALWIHPFPPLLALLSEYFFYSLKNFCIGHNFVIKNIPVK